VQAKIKRVRYVMTSVKENTSINEHRRVIVETFVYLVLAGSTNTVSSRKLKKKTLLF